MFARAFAKEKYCVTNACPTKPNEIDLALVRIVKAYRAGFPLCAADSERAMDLLRRWYEIYMKALQIVASLMDVIEERNPDKSRKGKLIFERIREFEDGRFVSLVVDRSKTFMRNSIVHETVFPNAEKDEISFFSDGETIKMRYQEVDSHIKEMHQRVLAFFEAKQIFEIYSTKSSEIAMVSRIEEKLRLTQELVKLGIFKITEDGNFKPE